jgi:hypothetical protein
MLPVVALNAPENGKMVVVEIAYGLSNLGYSQKGPAYQYFPENTEIFRESIYDQKGTRALSNS